MQRIFLLILSVLAVLATGGNGVRAETAGNDFGWSEEVDAALVLFENGDAETAIERLNPIAEAGDVHAQFLLGRLYSEEFEFRDNQCRALYWFKEAGTKGYAAALAAVGNLYLNGYCTRSDYDKAARYFKQALRLGDASAALSLTYLHLTIESGHFDPQATVRRTQTAWELRRTAVNLDWVAINAATLLGRLYWLGYGISKDPVKAEKFLRIAANQGSPDAQHMLGEFYREQYGHPRQGEFSVWLSLAAHQGDLSAVDLIAELSDETRTDARRLAMAKFETMIANPRLAIGRAAKWCFVHQPNAELCIRFAYRHHFGCDPRIALGYFDARYVDSIAYDACRREVFDSHAEKGGG